MRMCKILVKDVKSALAPAPGGPCKTPYNTCKFHAFWGARAAGDTKKLGIW